LSIDIIQPAAEKGHNSRRPVKDRWLYETVPVHFANGEAAIPNLTEDGDGKECNQGTYENAVEADDSQYGGEMQLHPQNYSPLITTDNFLFRKDTSTLPSVVEKKEIEDDIQSTPFQRPVLFGDVTDIGADDLQEIANDEDGACFLIPGDHVL
jgi:hypothetical protein